MERRRFRHYLIKRTMQMRITFMFLLLAITFSCVSGVVVFMTVWPAVSKFVPLSVLQHVQYQLMIRLFCYSIPFIAVIIIAGFIMTHRIAGAVYSLEQQLDKLNRGENVPEFHIRDNDELQELVAKLNECMKHF